MTPPSKLSRSTVIVSLVIAAITLLLSLLLLVAWQGQANALAALQQDVRALVVALATPTPTIPPTPPPSPTPHPALARLEALRAEAGVRQLEPLENERSVLNLPDGVYGFTVPWIINTDPTGVVGGTGINRISLYRESFGTLQMEVHKTPDGDVLIVGYVSSAQLDALRDAVAGEQVEITLFTHPYEGFEYPIAVPLASILVSNNRRVEGIYVNDMIVVGTAQPETGS